MVDNSELSCNLRDFFSYNLHRENNTSSPNEEYIQDKIRSIKIKIQKLKAIKGGSSKNIESFEKAIEEYETTRNKENSSRDFIFEGHYLDMMLGNINTMDHPRYHSNHFRITDPDDENRFKTCIEEIKNILEKIKNIQGQSDTYTRFSAYIEWYEHRDEVNNYNYSLDLHSNDLPFFEARLNELRTLTTSSSLEITEPASLISSRTSGSMNNLISQVSSIAQSTGTALQTVTQLFISAFNRIFTISQNRVHINSNENDEFSSQHTPIGLLIRQRAVANINEEAEDYNNPIFPFPQQNGDNELPFPTELETPSGSFPSFLAGGGSY